MTRRKLNKIQIFSLIIGVFVIVLPLVIGHFNDKNYIKKMTEHPVIVSGEITGFTKVYKRTDALDFKFEYNRKNYSTYSSTSGKPSDYEKIHQIVMNKTFPVLINRVNPQKYSKILVVPEDFEEFGLKFPDSLKWVLQYIDR